MLLLLLLAAARSTAVAPLTTTMTANMIILLVGNCWPRVAILLHILRISGNPDESTC